MWLTDPAHQPKKRLHAGQEESEKLPVVVQHTIVLGIFLQSSLVSSEQAWHPTDATLSLFWSLVHVRAPPPNGSWVLSVLAC